MLFVYIYKEYGGQEFAFLASHQQPVALSANPPKRNGGVVTTALKTANELTQNYNITMKINT